MARNRNVQIIFWVSEAEKSMIEEKMAQAGMTNLSAYLRRIAIDGMIVRLELPELKEMVSLLRYASNNINQIARRMNESGRVYGTDLEQVIQNQEQLWDMANGIHRAGKSRIPSKQLGHASVNTTENFYSHIIEENKVRASECIADVLLRKKA